MSKKRSAVSAASDDEHNEIQYFLLKSEPADYSIDDMKRDTREEWDGVRNFQARNILRSMKVGDRAFFYHSQTKVPGIVGTVQIARIAAPDPTAYNPQSKYFDEKSTEKNSRWDSVLVEYEQTFPIVLTLKELKDAVSLNPDGALANMALFKQTRLSVVPMSSEQWEEVMTMIHNKSRDAGHDVLESNEGNDSKKKRID
jgi:predicted RNA-binding protein with PUA-like domain